MNYTRGKFRASKRRPFPRHPLTPIRPFGGANTVIRSLKSHSQFPRNRPEAVENTGFFAEAKPEGRKDVRVDWGEIQR